MKRRTALSTMAFAIGASIIHGQREAPLVKKPISQRINHSVCKWCYGNTPLEELADKAVDIGLKSIELLDPDEWDVVMSRGLTCAISNGSSLGITKGFNDPNNHAQLKSDLESIIPKASAKGIQQIICFSGNRNGMNDEVGIENCAVGLDPILKLAKEHNVTIVMELLNSKVSHKDYMCDHTKWGATLVEKLGSNHFKLLYDIYHMQVMEGDVIRTIKANHKYISHYHTAGVPGRNEINESQELYYPAIMKAIADIEGFDGYVAQEFIPTRKDPFLSLAEGVTICDV
ncbi:MAG: TIM barrel protein [Saprospiraceae bacterium]